MNQSSKFGVISSSGRSSEHGPSIAFPGELAETTLSLERIEQVHQEWMAALDAVRDPIFMHDQQFRILRCNKAYQELAGIPFRELIGRPYNEVFPKLNGPMSCCTGKTRDADEHEEEISIDGATYRMRAFQVLDRDGRSQYSVHIMENTTEHRRLEALARESQKIAQDVINNSPLLFYSLDKEGNFTLVNDSLLTLLGSSREHLIGHGREVAMPKHIAEQHRNNDIEVMRQGKAIEFEETNVEADGLHVYLSKKFPLFDLLGKVSGVCGISTDITRRKKAEVDLSRANRALMTLSSGNGALIRSTDEAQILEAICSAAVNVGGYQMAWIGFVEHDTEKSIRMVAQRGADAEYVRKAGITWADSELGQGPTGRAVRIGKTQVAQNIAQDPTMLPWRTEALKYGFSSSIALPLLEGDKCFGVLTIYSNETDAFDSNEVNLLEEMANDLAFGLVTLRLRVANQKHEQRLNSSMMQTIEAIASIVEMRDPYTSGHQARVAQLAQSMAQAMRLPEEQIHAIHLAGLVHDLGKIKIPSEILSRPGKLNEIEYMLIKQHPQAGFDILNAVDFTWPIAQMVLQHHERLDGSGYPQGLKGDEILMGARILSVADVVEAMSSHRPYRPGLGMKAALSEITSNRGLLYDPQVVDACLNLFTNAGYVLSG